MKREHLSALIVSILAVLAAIFFAYTKFAPAIPPVTPFDGQRAFQDLLLQEKLGPRIPGSVPHAELIEWLTGELTQYGWDVEVLQQPYNGKTAQNIIAKRGSGPVIMLGAHYDTRQYADNDPVPSQRQQPVPGANDGASGVAVLTELARTLPVNLNKEVWLVFFDLEDQGGINGRAFIEGSNAFANALTAKPQSVVIVDMVADTNLNIHYERNSNPALSGEIWNTAKDLGYANQFVAQYKFSMIDDHSPFLNQNIPAVDLIDFDYPSWHTTADTSAQCSPQSLQAVGMTLWTWLQH